MKNNKNDEFTKLVDKLRNSEEIEIEVKIKKIIKKIKFNNEEEKNDLIKRINNKGINVYLCILDFINENELDNDYETLSSIFIYDKRIRDILYKFISYVEEKIRARIINKYKLDQKTISNIYRLTFGELIKLSKNLDIINDSENKIIENIRVLRNEVFHNNLILISNGKINEKNINNIKILSNYLENKIRESFLEDIKNKEKKEINHNKYMLKEFRIPEIIKLSNMICK